MNILITGGNGFVGSNLTVALLKLGHSVAVYDNYSSSTDGTVQSLCNANNAPTDKLSVICGDVVDAIHIKAVTLAFNPDIIFHLAAELSIYDCNNDPYKAVNVNVIGSMNIYLAAISVGAKVIFAESSAVYEACELPFTEDKASPVTTYACSKLSAAIMANGLSKTHGLRYNALRYFNITGEGIDYNRTVPPLFAGLAIRIIGGQPVIIFGDETRRRDFIHINDITEFNVMLIESGHLYDNETFNLGTGTSTSLIDIAEMISHYLNEPLDVLYYPEINGEAHTIVANMEYTTNSTGFFPKHTMYDMVKSSVDFCLKEIELGNINVGGFMNSIDVSSVKIGV